MVEEDGEESYTSDCCLQFECGTEGGGEGDRVDKLNEGVTVHKYCLDAIEEQQQDKLCIVCVLYVLFVYCLLDVILDFGFCVFSVSLPGNFCRDAPGSRHRRQRARTQKKQNMMFLGISF